MQNLWRQPINGGSPTRITRLTDGRVAAPEVSPEESWILVSRLIDDIMMSLWMVPVSGGDPVRMTDPRMGCLADVSFSTDGGEFIYLHIEPRHDVVLIRDDAAASG